MKSTAHRVVGGTLGRNMKANEILPDDIVTDAVAALGHRTKAAAGRCQGEVLVEINTGGLLQWCLNSRHSLKLPKKRT